MRYVKGFLRLLLAVLFILAGVNHFRDPGFYTNIMPDYIPFHGAMVAISGVTEIVAGVLLLIPGLAWLGAWCIVAMLVVFCTVHVHMIVHADQYASVPLWLLWFRMGLQGVLILWAYWFTRPLAPQIPKLD
jgi:uncharacterized membrane protein